MESDSLPVKIPVSTVSLLQNGMQIVPTPELVCARAPLVNARLGYDLWLLLFSWLLLAST